MRYLTGRARARAEVLEEWLPAMSRDAGADGRLGYWAGLTDAGFVGWWCLNPGARGPERRRAGLPAAPRRVGPRLRRPKAALALLAHGFDAVGLDARLGPDHGRQPGVPGRDGADRPGVRAHLGRRVERAPARLGAGRGGVRAHPAGVARAYRNQASYRVVDTVFGLSHELGRDTPHDRIRRVQLAGVATSSPSSPPPHDRPGHGVREPPRRRPRANPPTTRSPSFAYGTKVKAAAGQLRSGRTAPSWIGCTRQAGKIRTNEVLAVDAPTNNPLIQLGAITSRSKTFKAKKQGIAAGTESTSTVAVGRPRPAEPADPRRRC